MKANRGAKIVLYSGDGKVIREWRTPGRVELRDGAFSFVEPGSDHAIRVTRSVVVDAAP